MTGITHHKTCPRCGSEFSCGADLSQDGHACWCNDLPPLKYRSGEGCLCPGCLRALVADEAAAEGKGV
jgi:hypothetical protein